MPSSDQPPTDHGSVISVMGPGSVSMRIYPHNDLAAPRVVEELRAQAQRATACGFDGVMCAEHHGGFAGYLPNPLQAAGWMLEAMPRGWCAPCPILLPIRPTVLVAEEVAWLAARFPQRVGIGVAPGGLAADFELMDQPFAEALPRFRAELGRLVSLLSGRALGGVANDPALAACEQEPVPVVSTAMSPAAARRAARCGAGMVFDGATAAARLGELSGEYRAAGGDGPVVLIRRAWLGAPPRDALREQQDRYRNYSSAAAQQHWSGDGFIVGSAPDEVAEALAAAVAQSGATALNVRFHVPGVSPAQAHEQIETIGLGVLPRLRAFLAGRDR